MDVATKGPSAKWTFTFPLGFDIFLMLTFQMRLSTLSCTEIATKQCKYPWSLMGYIDIIRINLMAFFKDEVKLDLRWYTT